MFSVIKALAEQQKSDTRLLKASPDLRTQPNFRSSSDIPELNHGTFVSDYVYEVGFTVCVILNIAINVGIIYFSYFSSFWTLNMGKWGKKLETMKNSVRMGKIEKNGKKEIFF